MLGVPTSCDCHEMRPSVRLSCSHSYLDGVTRMLEAQIVSPRGSLYIAAEATAYDVQELQSHVRALYAPNASDVRLALRLDPDSRARIRELVIALAAKLASEGVRVSVDDAVVWRNERAPRRASMSAREP